MLAAEAKRLGFVKKKDIPVVFFVNNAYSRLRERDIRIELSLGDSDQV